MPENNCNGNNGQRRYEATVARVCVVLILVAFAALIVGAVAQHSCSR